MTRYAIVAAFVAVSAIPVASAQDLQVKGTSSTILMSQNVDVAAIDKVAVTGLSTPQAYWGVGAHFEGGYLGLSSYATMAGAGTRYGGYFNAANGATNYGIFAFASGGTAYAGYFSGDVYVSGALLQPSDARLKLDIADLPEALPLVLGLRPKAYQYRTEEFPSLNLPEGRQIGLVAQEVAAVLPDAVREVVAPAEKGKSEERFLTVDYMKVVPLLIKAVQEQQAEIEALRAEVEQLKSK